MSVQFSYAFLWSFYNQASEEAKQDILRQLNIEEVLQYGNIRIRKEILSYAPQEIVNLYKPSPPVKSVDQLRHELQKIIRR